MPGELEKYIDLYNEADKMFRAFRQAIMQLQSSVQLTSQTPQSLLSPSSGKWPTQDEIRQLYVTFSQKAATLNAEFQRLPQEYKKFAPQPDSVGHH